MQQISVIDPFIDLFNTALYV